VSGPLRGFAALCLALLAPALVTPADVSALTASEERGKKIYFTGRGGEAITAYLGEGEHQLELPGEAAVCGSCHGHDGTGRPESGVRPTNITWKYLARSYGHVHARGVEHPSFDEESLVSYLRTGLYPGGRRGDSSMPVYEMSERDLDDLVSYLKRVGQILDPGLSETAIRIGTIVPAEGPLGEIGAVIGSVIEAHFREVNAAGGIYGRRLELVVHKLAKDDESAAETVGRWLAEDPPFAFVSPFTPHTDFEVQSALSGNEIPVIGPFTLYSIRSFLSNRYVFYLYPDLGEQLEALVQFAATRLELSEPRLAVIYPDERALTDVIAIVEKAGRQQGWGELRREPFPVGRFDAGSSAQTLQDAGIDVVISLGVEQELRAFLTAAAERGWSPHVLASGALSGSGLLEETPEAFGPRLHLAYPTLPQDRKPWAVKVVSRILERNELARGHIQATISAYSSVTVLVEALRRAGRGLGRRELTAELEGFYEFDTGLTPPITFTSNRRIGAKGAYVLDPGSIVDGHLPESVPWVQVK